MHDDPTSPALLHFIPGEKQVVDALIQIVRSLPGRFMLTPKQLHQSAILLHALERLPLATSGMGLTMCLIQPGQEERFWMAITIDDERLELDKGRTIYSDAGSDNESQTEFLVYTCGRSRRNRLGNVLGWVDMFRWMCEEADGIEVDFDNFGDSTPDWEDIGESGRWDKLPETEVLEDE